jgi:endogenous inhibitor of DNA gyrase (YacG/DUF329 family)
MKSGNLFDDFVWRRAIGGYAWKDVGDGALLLVAADGRDAAEETYRLGAKSSTGGLFIEFAELKQTPDAFLAFANQFGLLGHPVTVACTELRKGEFIFYRDHRKVVCKPGSGVFAAEFYSSQNDQVYGKDHPGASWLYHVKRIRWLIRARQTRTKWSDSLQKEDADFALREAVAVTLDDELNGRLTPVSLIGALWLQAALGGDKEYRSCPICKTPIEISRTGGARTDAVFCSDKCKSRDYRQRKATARSLRDDGVPLLKIANQIDTDPATVRGWLK